MNFNVPTAIRCVVHEWPVVETRSEHKVLVGKSLSRRKTGRYICKREGDIKTEIKKVSRMRSGLKYLKLLKERLL
jgi:hypothetical protein